MFVLCCLYILCFWLIPCPALAREYLYMGRLTEYQRLFSLLMSSCLSIHPSFGCCLSSIHPLILSFIHLSNLSSHRKPVPAAPPNGSLIICSQSFQSLLFRHMHVSPKWCQDWAESSVVQHMLSALSSFPPDDLSSHSHESKLRVAARQNGDYLW